MVIVNDIHKPPVRSSGVFWSSLPELPHSGTTSCNAGAGVDRTRGCSLGVWAELSLHRNCKPLPQMPLCGSRRHSPDLSMVQRDSRDGLLARHDYASGG